MELVTYTMDLAVYAAIANRPTKCICAKTERVINDYAAHVEERYLKYGGDYSDFREDIKSIEEWRKDAEEMGQKAFEWREDSERVCSNASRISFYSK